MNATLATTETRPTTDRAPRTTWVRPAVDIAEAAGGLVLVFDVPGVPKDAVSVTLDERILTVEARRTATRGYRAAFTLPETIDGAAIEASLADGVLTVSLARVAKPEPRKISVQ